MQKLFLSLATVFLYCTAQAQFTKGNWLVGGTGNFLTSQNSYSGPNFSTTSDRIDLKISPNVGYFFTDNLGVGLRPSFSKYNEQVNGEGGLTSNVSRFEFGPFARYYFLSSEKQYNILADMSYQHGIYYSKPTRGTINTFSASAWTVVFFNSSVGLELLLGYYNRKEVMPLSTTGEIVTTQKGFQIGIGFQIHLEK